MANHIAIRKRLFSDSVEMGWFSWIWERESERVPTLWEREPVVPESATQSVNPSGADPLKGGIPDQIATVHVKRQTILGKYFAPLP